MADYEWAQITLGQNTKVQAIAGTAGKASALVSANLSFAKITLELGKVLLLASINPQLLVLVAIADEIDNFMDDLKGTGFFFLEVTARGFMVKPRDDQGNLIKLSLGSATLRQQWEDAKNDSDPNVRADFIQWSKSRLGIDPTVSTNPYSQSKYEIEQGKTQVDSIAAGAIETDIMVQKDAIFGFAKMTPSQIIATMIAAMDDSRDPDRPKLSDSADVAAVIVIIGFTDVTKIMKPIYETLDLFMRFFGGENSTVMKGVKEVRDIIKQAQDFLDIPDDCQSTVTVVDVCGVRGTEDDREILKQIIPDSQWNEFATDASAYYYNYKSQFQVGDYVAGPNNILTGSPALGYIKDIKETKVDEEDPSHPYVQQTLVINCNTGPDKDAFDTFANGAILQKVAYVTIQETKIDNNTGEPVKQPERISFKYMKDLTFDEAKAVNSVTREPEKYLLTKLSTVVDLVEEHGTVGRPPIGKFRTKNTIQGEIFRNSNPIAPFPPPPNFQGYNLGEFIGEMELLFKSVQRFTNTLRSFAAGSKEAIDRLFKFLDLIIADLEELVNNIKAVLKIFTNAIPDTGVFSLSIPSTSGGDNAIKSALSNATNAPPNSLDYSMGFMLMGGAAAIDPLLTLLGVD